MPAVITHYLFGEDVLELFGDAIGRSQDEYDAFLLGNQGPDPLFFVVLAPTVARHYSLGIQMHHEKPSELLVAFKRSLTALPDDDHAIGRAYALGFLCHYLLDSTVHPLVYSRQSALCEAGEPGLGPENGHEVHATIESEFDEVLLFRRKGLTIRDFSPEKEALAASGRVLSIASRMYLFVALATYQRVIPARLFASSVASYRLALRSLRSPRGIKRSVLAHTEEVFRTYSFFRSMSHRDIALEESAFENRAHRTWKDPFSEAVRTESLEDLLDDALHRAQTAIAAFNRSSFDVDEARAITHDLDFSGESTVATLLVVENG